MPITQNKYFSETIDRNVNAYNNNTNNKKEYQSSQNKNQLYIVAWHFLQNTHCSKNGKKFIYIQYLKINVYEMFLHPLF